MFFCLLCLVSATQTAVWPDRYAEAETQQEGCGQPAHSSPALVHNFGVRQQASVGCAQPCCSCGKARHEGSREAWRTSKTSLCLEAERTTFLQDFTSATSLSRKSSPPWVEVAHQLALLAGRSGHRGSRAPDSAEALFSVTCLVASAVLEAVQEGGAPVCACAP